MFDENAFRTIFSSFHLLNLMSNGYVLCYIRFISSARSDVLRVFVALYLRLILSALFDA